MNFQKDSSVLDSVSQINSTVDSKAIDDEYIPNENFEFRILHTDTNFVLTVNRSRFKEGVTNLITKMYIFKEPCTICLDSLENTLKENGIEKLYIFSIRNDDNLINKSGYSKDSNIIYLDLKRTEFIKFLNGNTRKFLEYNPYSLFILRDGNYLDIKNIFAYIDNTRVNIGRGGSQKAHVLSPLDLRLSLYLLSLYNYETITYLNTFNGLNKSRYLSYADYTYNTYRNIGLKPRE